MRLNVRVWTALCAVVFMLSMGTRASDEDPKPGTFGKFDGWQLKGYDLAADVSKVPEVHPYVFSLLFGNLANREGHIAEVAYEAVEGCNEVSSFTVPQKVEGWLRVESESDDLADCFMCQYRYIYDYGGGVCVVHYLENGGGNDNFGRRFLVRFGAREFWDHGEVRKRKTVSLLGEAALFKK